MCQIWFYLIITSYELSYSQNMIWVIHWLNKVIECRIHECSLNGKDNDLSYYLIYLGPFCIGQLCMFHLFS